MKSYRFLIVFILALTSCKEVNKTSVEKESIIEMTKTEVITTKSEPEFNGTFLCKINGKNWIYTKASGIVSRHKKTKKRTAIITFTKQLEKGKESVQLFYDGDTYMLEKATAILKLQKNGGGIMSAMYQLLNVGGKRIPESKIKGTLDLSNPTKVSGTADILNMKIRFEEGSLKDKSMGTISFSPINFSGLGYSDAEKLFGSKNN